jgi:chemotaxis protein MotB
MISYTDVITILLIFFVAMAAQKFPRPQQDAIFGRTPAPAAPAVPAAPKPTSQPSRTLVNVQTALQKHGLDMKMEARGLVISLPQAILFQSGEDQINRDALPILTQIADVIRNIPNEVNLIGHADAVPIHNRHFKSNWDLSMARSLKILELLTRQYGIPESRLYLASYGPFRPADSNDTPDGRARNRRVEIVILEDSGGTQAPAGF